MSPCCSRESPFLGGGSNFPKIRTCQFCSDFGQQICQCGRGVADSSLKLVQVITGQFWGEQLTECVTCLCAASLLCHRAPGTVSLAGTGALQPHPGLRVLQAMDLWLFLCITTCSKRCCPSPVPPCPSVPAHAPAGSLLQTDCGTRCLWTVSLCCDSPCARPWLWQRDLSPTKILLLFPSVWMMPSRPSAVGNLG